MLAIAKKNNDMSKHRLRTARGRDAGQKISS